MNFQHERPATNCVFRHTNKTGVCIRWKAGRMCDSPLTCKFGHPGIHSICTGEDTTDTHDRQDSGGTQVLSALTESMQVLSERQTLWLGMSRKNFSQQQERQE